MDTKQNRNYIENIWDSSISLTLMEYIKIPNKSPLFDRDWQANGHMDAAVQLVMDWCKENAVEGTTAETIQLENRTPVILLEIPGSNNDTILLYGHLDKQPEMTGWDSDLHPWKPVLKDEKLYGRGGADDGYALFASLAAIKSLHEQNIPHARCVILIECSEESGSPDLPFYIDILAKKIGKPGLIICLDSGCCNYEQLWLTTSLRGLVSGNLTIGVLKQGVHSGVGGGVVPSCMQIFNQLLQRIENENGEITLAELQVDIPSERLTQAKVAATVLKNQLFTNLPFEPGVKALPKTADDLILARTWKPALSVIGCDGMPSNDNAGNVTLPSLTFKLSMRLPPTCDAKQAAMALKKALEENPPYQAKVNFEVLEFSSGWNAPAEKAWLVEEANQASLSYFGKKAVYLGEGGSIPFMGMLGKKFPHAQFVITGVLGPGSNAHGPNEFLHIPTAKKITACIANIIEKQFKSLS